MKTKLGIFIQARMGSTRLPGKIFKKIGDRPALKVMIDNIKGTKYSNDIYILTSNKQIDDTVENFARSEGVKCFRGDEKDVLARFYFAAKHHHIDDIVRLTGDCPFISMNILDNNIKAYYTSNRPDYYHVRDYPIGIGAVEIMNINAIKIAYTKSRSDYHREHVMTYLVDNPKDFRLVIREAPRKYRYPNLRLTMDERKDLELLNVIYKKLHGLTDIDSILKLYNLEPKLFEINKDIKSLVV